MTLTSALGIALAPLGAALLFGVIGSGIRLAIARYMPECWLKRQLLLERVESQYSAANGRIAEEADRHPNGWRDCFKKNPIVDCQATTQTPKAKR